MSELLFRLVILSGDILNEAILRLSTGIRELARKWWNGRRLQVEAEGRAPNRKRWQRLNIIFCAAHTHALQLTSHCE